MYNRDNANVKTLTPTSTIGSLQELLEALYSSFSVDGISVDHLKAVLSSYKSCPADWQKFAHSDSQGFTRNLVDDGNGKFNLLVFCWGPGHESKIHSHADCHSLVKVLDGCLVETRFEWPGEENGPLVQTKRTPFYKDQVTYINDSMGLHRMENTSDSDPCVTLHLYCPPYECLDTFDENTGAKESVKVTYTSKHGKKVNS